MPYPNDFQQRTLWSGLTGLAIVLLGAILVGLIWLTGQVLGYLQPVLVPLAVAGIVAYLLDPVVEWLQHRRKLSRFKAVLAVFGAFTLVVVIFFSLLIPKLIEQGGKLLGDEENLGPSVVNKIKDLQEVIPGATPLFDWITGYVDPESGEIIAKPYPFPEYNKDNSIRGYRYRNGDFFPVENLRFEVPPTKPAPGDAPPEEPVSTLEAALMPDRNVALPEDHDPDPSLEKSETRLVSREEQQAVRDYHAQTKELKFSDTKLGQLLTDNWQTLTATGLDWLRASTKVFGFLGYLLGFLLVPVYLFYFLNESSKIKATWHQYIPLKASRFKDEVVDTLSEINSYLISFFRGQVLVSLIDGILVGVALSVFQLPYGFLIGLALAILGILPFIGNILCMIPASIIALIHFGGSDAHHQWLGDSTWAYVVAVIAIFLVVQQINSLVTAPKIVGDSVGLHPMTVIFSIFFWSLLLGGFLGALLAVPLTAAIKVLFSRYIWQRKVSPQLEQPAVDEDKLLPAN
ncbi:AI-2E family transporter [Roseibacillus ishigakijimensis]|uniref:AI-2E family transporter n=1 Tax=Roseibacillus ishigakijimensis TaxID=454146 RepID=A0A934RMF2_9BACT|nr:AI-2E family transporter [Roseibacillus ishigakijimensis]MBK1834074.1 AI-2E family transporter [Roseibacillus ishigakijimensis]